MPYEAETKAAIKARLQRESRWTPYLLAKDKLVKDDTAPGDARRLLIGGEFAPLSTPSAFHENGG